MPSKELRAYVSVSYSEKQTMRAALDSITSTLARFKIESFIFVDHYSFTSDQEVEMMKQAMKDIDDCDLVIVEASYKAIGIGIEAGYGKGKNKPIIYLRRKDAEHSTTVSGISDFHIIYDGISDLQSKLSDVIEGIQNRLGKTTSTIL
jgi:hypothetical protein